MTIHYNKLQADPKQGMSLDIGELDGSGGPTSPRPVLCLFRTAFQELCGF